MAIDTPINLFPPAQVPWGWVEIGGKKYPVHIDPKQHKVLEAFLRRLGGESNYNITTLADLTATDNGIIIGNGTNFVVESGSTARDSLGLEIGSDVLAYDSGVQQIADLADPNADRILFWDDSAGAFKFLTVGTNLTITDTTITASGGGGGDVDVIEDVFGTPDTSHEFDSSDLSALTSRGAALDVENAHTTIPSYYFVQDNASSLSLSGRSIAAPSAPFTAIAKMDWTIMRDFGSAGLFIAVSPPGASVGCIMDGDTRDAQVVKFTNLTTVSGSLGAVGGSYWNPPIYLCIRVNSSTDVDYYISKSGRLWVPILVGNNPGFTIGLIALLFKSQNTTPTSAAFDYLRVWNSALTIPGDY